MAEVVSTNQFRNGMHIELEGQTWRIVEFQHVKPGKGGAFVRTKLKSYASGAVIDRTFRAGEKFARVRTETKNMQYLYDAGEEVVFMDEQTTSSSRCRARPSLTRCRSCSPPPRYRCSSSATSPPGSISPPRSCSR